MQAVETTSAPFPNPFLANAYWAKQVGWIIHKPVGLVCFRIFADIFAPQIAAGSASPYSSFKFPYILDIFIPKYNTVRRSILPLLTCGHGCTNHRAPGGMNTTDRNVRSPAIWFPESAPWGNVGDTISLDFIQVTWLFFRFHEERGHLFGRPAWMMPFFAANSFAGCELMY